MYIKVPPQFEFFASPIQINFAKNLRSIHCNMLALFVKLYYNYFMFGQALIKVKIETLKTIGKFFCNFVTVAPMIGIDPHGVYHFGYPLFRVDYQIERQKVNYFDHFSKIGSFIITSTGE